MTIQCPTCLTENPDNATICIACGFPLTPTQTSSIYHLPSGTILGQGKYQIEKVLGEGGFGITYQGVYLQNSAKVAIKELWPEKAARTGNTVCWPHSITPAERQKQLDSFQTEASYLSRCSHRNIVKIYDWFQENNTVYLVMEFVAGKTLYQMFQEQGKLPENQITDYFIQIAEALKVVHQNQLLHRDIKPDNILIDQQNRAVLIDFGATKEFIAGQTREMSVTLSQGYAPLEQYSYRSQRWPATDFYALCASMYELLTAQLPAPAPERASADTLIPPRQLSPHLSPLIEKVILTGMQFRVEDRFQTADELIDALNGRFVSPSQKRARELVAKGELTAAVQAYEKYLKTEPNHGESAVELALVQCYLNDNQAKIAAEKAIQLQPQDGRGYGVLGLVSCRQSKWSEAIKYLQQAAKLSPQEAWIQANLGWGLGKCGDWSQAEIAVNRALQLAPDSTFALGLQAWIAVNQKEWKAGVKAATQAIFKSNLQSNLQSHSTPSSDSQLLQQWVYPYLIISLDHATVTQQARDVERRIQEFITQVPDSAFALGFQGWKQALQGLWSPALSNLTPASSKSQVPSWVLINYAITQENLHNCADAIRIYETHQHKFPGDAFVLFRLGTLHGKLNEWNKARLYLQQAIQIKPDYPQAHHNLGWVLLNIRAQDNQVEHFREMLSAYRQAVQLYTQQQQHSLAADIQQAFQLIGMNI
ncbi:protein kinase [Anabaenopsis sp. FSS-46]|uniref:serine/threonine-protein kinase n=1 Tax=Anabaenopsis sp. FSS-46 TaxID=2971766 RepID=UPI002475DDEB|nr:serine/threonine-protein kinase [Anabaenopsis sp. FSS-46]MDH6100398.1 protein kinase [Anabaenopsis sp. FSS-46]